jgi:hypothetical protein
MYETIFAIDLKANTEKCLVPIAEHGNTGCCRGCRKPRPDVVGGYCVSCAVSRGINPLQPHALIQQSA